MGMAQSGPAAVVGKLAVMINECVSAGETGQELLLLDGDVGREPLMVEIARGIFLDALKVFRTRSLYANALNDNTVPYHSAAILLTDVYLLYTPYEACPCPHCIPVTKTILTLKGRGLRQ